MCSGMTVPKQTDELIGTPHSTIERGVIEYGDNIVPFQKESPHEPISDEPIFLLTGLGADLASLALPSSTLAEQGFVVYSVGHEHTAVMHPIRRNAEDAEAVIECANPTGKIHLGGLSMGGPGALLVAGQMPEIVDSISLFAPAMISRIHPSRGVKIVGENFVEAFRGEQDYGAVALDSIRVIRTRTQRVMAQLLRLSAGNVHGRVRTLKKDSEIEIMLFAMQHDCFFHPRDLAKAAKKLGIGFELFNEGTAGHSALTYHPEVARMAGRFISQIEHQPEGVKLALAS